MKTIPRENPNTTAPPSQTQIHMPTLLFSSLQSSLLRSTDRANSSVATGAKTEARGAAVEGFRTGDVRNRRIRVHSCTCRAEGRSRLTLKTLCYSAISLLASPLAAPRLLRFSRARKTHSASWHEGVPNRRQRPASG